MTGSMGSSPSRGRAGPRPRSRSGYDPPPRTLGQSLLRLWVVGTAAVVFVLVLVVVTGPGDLSILTRLFVWVSTFVFSVWLLREHRRRIPVRQRLLIFQLCGTSLVLLFLILTVSAF